VDCPYVASGKNEEELMTDVVKHSKEIHKYTDEQLQDPEMIKTVKAAIKHE
jgi:predicted small metal-binding protein